VEVRHHGQHAGREHGEQREQRHLEHREALDARVATAEQQGERQGQEPQHPQPDGDRGHDQVHHLRHAAEHRADLQERDEHHQRPGPDQPAHSGDAWSGHPVETLEARLAGRDRVAAELLLDDRLQQTGEEHHPERGEARLRAEGGGRDQLAGADDRSRQHHARTDLPERGQQPARGIEDVLGPEPVRIGGDVGGHRAAIVAAR
jgi:hypothetical protein